MPIKPLPEDPAIRAFISKGGKVACEEDVKEEWTMVSLRIPKYFIKQIDDRRKKRVGITRNAFILQILQEFLERI